MNGLSRILGSIVAANSERVFDEDEIRYGLEIFLGGLLQILLLIAVGWSLGILKQLLAIMFSSGFYRRYAGGAHCTAYYRCTMTCLITFPVLAYSARFIDSQYFIIYSVFIMLFSLAMVYLKAPIDTEVKPVTDPQKRFNLKLRAAGLVVILLITSFFTQWLGKDLIAIGILLGICWQTLTMTHLGVIYVRFWDIILSNWWVNNMEKEEMKC